MSLRLFPPESSPLTISVWKLILAAPLATINIQTEIVNGERGHYLVWSVRVNVAMIRVSKLLGSNYNPNPNFTLTLIITLNSP